MSRPTTNCAKCGRPKAPPVTTPQFTEMELRDIAFVMTQNAQRVAAHQLVTQVWNASMYDVPDPPAIMLTEKQHQDNKRAFTARQQLTVNADQDTVPDPPAIMLRR